jgi:hypothetical protein
MKQDDGSDGTFQDIGASALDLFSGRCSLSPYAASLSISSWGTGAWSLLSLYGKICTTYGGLHTFNHLPEYLKQMLPITKLWA